MTSLSLERELNFLIGPLLAGTWVNSILLALVFVHVARYFSRMGEKSKLGVNIILVVCTVCDTIGVVISYAITYLYTVSHWGDPSSLLDVPSMFSGAVVVTSINVVVVQCYLLLRVWVLWRSYLLVGGLTLFVAGGFVSGLAAAVKFAAFVPTPTIHQTVLQPYFIAWSSFVAAADVLIALALLVRLYQLKKMLHDGSKHGLTGTRRVIYLLMLRAFETGGVLLLEIIMGLVLYTLRPQQMMGVALAALMGRIYTLTLLVNLNATSSSINQPEARSSISFRRKPTQGRSPESAIDLGSSMVSAVHVHYETTTRIDEVDKGLEVRNQLFSMTKAF